jgi:hypothetical protein
MHRLHVPATSTEAGVESVGYRPDLVWSGAATDLETVLVHSAVRNRVILFGIIAAHFGQRSVCRFDLHLGKPCELITRDLYVSNRRSSSPRATSVLPLESGQLIFGYSAFG